LWISLGVLLLSAVIFGISGACSDEKLFDKVPDDEYEPEYLPPYNPQTNFDEIIPTMPKAPDMPQKFEFDVETPKYNPQPPEVTALTTKDRVYNTLIGASMGLAVGGVALVLVGGGIGIVGFATTLSAPVASINALVVGSLGYNVYAMLLGYIFGVEAEPLEW
jgi:hypothetical protein